MSAPAAKAFSLPVTIMQPMASSASKASSAAPSSSISCVVERVELLGPVQRDDADLAAFGADLDVFVGHTGISLS